MTVIRGCPTGISPWDALIMVDFETTGVDTDLDFPIQLGMAVLNHELVEMAAAEWLICPQEIAASTSYVLSHQTMTDVEKVALVEKLAWPERFARAYDFHRIPFGRILLDGLKPLQVVQAIDRLISPLQTQYGFKRLILCSDNSQFEFRFMKRLYGTASAMANPPFIKWPFHYCCWDTSMLLEMTGIGDPPKHTVVHQGLADVRQLAQYMRTAARTLYERNAIIFRGVSF